MIDTPLIDRTWTVHDVVVRAPAAATAVLDAFGIDPRDADAVALEEAAAQGGADVDALLDALGEAARVSAVIEEARRVAASWG